MSCIMKDVSDEANKKIADRSKGSFQPLSSWYAEDKCGLYADDVVRYLLSNIIFCLLHDYERDAIVVIGRDLQRGDPNLLFSGS